MKYAERDDAVGQLDRTLMAEGTDLESVIQHGLAAVGFHWMLRKLRKKGAPEWAAYGISMVDWTLTQIGIQLYTRNRYLIAKQARLREYDKAMVREAKARAFKVDRSGMTEPADG